MISFGILKAQIMFDAMVSGGCTSFWNGTSAVFTEKGGKYEK
jgi:hypothetical protein